MSDNYQSLVKSLPTELQLRSLSQEALLSKFPPAVLARELESLPVKQREKIWPLIPVRLKGEVLVEVHREIRTNLVEKTPESELLSSLEFLQLDELADLDADLPLPIASAMVSAMDTQRKTRFKLVADFPDDTAGGLMDVDATAIRKDVTLKAVRRYLCLVRKKLGKLPEQIDHLVVVDKDNQVQGVLYLSDLVSLKSSHKVSAVMKTDFPLVLATQQADEVAQLFEDRDLVSVPVVNDSNQLIGRITVDDVIDYIRQQSDDSVLAQAGLTHEVDIFAPVGQASLSRAIWLGTNLITAFIAAWVIGLFESSIEQIVALAVLMPVVASMGGITGGQTLTLVTRGMALGRVSTQNILPLTLHELKVSFINSITWATVVFLVAYGWYGDWQLGLVFGFALFAVSLAGTFSGALIPIALKRFGVDPAIAGGVVLTTITDAVGFFVFLSIATLLLI